MKTNNNNSNETRNAVNNAAALTIWDEVTISLNAFELLALRYFAKRDSRDNSSEYDNEKAAQLLAKIDEAEKAYEPNEMTVWEEVTISLNAFDLLAARYMMERVIKREGLTKYDSEKAAAILGKLNEAEKAYKTASNSNEENAETVEVESDVITTYHHTNANRIALVCSTIAEAVGVTFGSTFPASDMRIDLESFTKWANGFQGCEYIDPAAPFFFAVRKQGSESGTREHCKERCAVLGRPVYVIKVEREELAGLFTLKVRVSSPATREQVTRTAELAKTIGNEAAPRLAQFETLKEKHPGAVLIFRENRAAAYTLYDEDADTAAEVLGVTVINANGFRFASFPHNDLDTHLPKLIRSGHRCAIVDVMEDTKHARQLAKRDTMKKADDRRHAPDFLTAQKFANMAAEDLAAQWDTDENAAAYALTETAADPRRIFEVTHGRAETLRSHARRAADRIADALNIEAGAAADLLAEVLTYWRENMITRPAEDDTHPEATETATEPAEGSEATDTTPATSEANSDRENKPQSHTAAAKLTAAALFLLSLTIGHGTPARIYTHDPAAVLAEVAAAGETVTAYTIAEA